MSAARFVNQTHSSKLALILMSLALLCAALFSAASASAQNLPAAFQAPTSHGAKLRAQLAKVRPATKKARTSNPAPVWFLQSHRVAKRSERSQRELRLL